MLPEKKKNLIIGIVAIVLLIVVIIIIANISNKIKSKNNEEEERNNYVYPSNYDYIGILKDEYDVYKVYGINNDEEVYLNVSTFYEIKDILEKDNKLLFYSDAINELRYDGKSFYLYELNSFYNNAYNIYLTTNNIVLQKDNTLMYFDYASNIDNATTISDNLLNDTVYVRSNSVYYMLEDGIYKYNMLNSENTNLFPDINEYTLIAVDKTHFYFTKDNITYTYNVTTDTLRDITYLVKNSILVTTLENGFIYIKDDNGIKTINDYSWDDDKTFSYPIDYNIIASKKLSTEELYIKKSGGDTTQDIIVNVESDEVIKELEHNYLYIMKVQNDN